MNKLLRPATGVVVASALTTLAPYALAQEGLTINGGLGLIAHSNAALNEDDEESDLERVVHAQVGYEHADDGLLRVDLDYAAQRLDFQDDEQEDETTLNGRADFLMHLIDRRLDAVLSHQISHQVTDRREVNVTDNQERRSVITAGFDGFAHFSAVDAFILSPRYVDVDFSESSQSDSERAMLTGTWQHQLSQVSATDLGVTYGKVKFDQSINDYDLMSVQLGYRAALSRLSYRLAAGVSKFDKDIGDDVDGYMVQASADYRGDGFNVGGALVRELTDTSIGLSGAELTLSNFTQADSNFDVQDILERTQADLYASRQFNDSNQLSGGLGYREDDYETQPRDERAYYARFEYQYTLNTYWTLGLGVRFEETKFLIPGNNARYRDTTPELFATYRASERLDFRFSVGQEKRKGTSSVASYTDDRALVSVNYRFY